MDVQVSSECIIEEMEVASDYDGEELEVRALNAVTIRVRVAPESYLARPVRTCKRLAACLKRLCNVSVALELDAVDVTALLPSLASTLSCRRAPIAFSANRADLVRPSHTLALQLGTHLPLSALDLSLNTLGDDFVVALVNALLATPAQLATLVDLQLESVGIGPKAATAVSRLVCVSRLRVLNLSHNPIGSASMPGNDAVSALASALKANESMTELVLAFCALSEGDLMLLAEFLAHASSITSVNVDGNRIENSAAVAHAWTSLIKRNPTIRFLSLFQTGVSVVSFRAMFFRGPSLFRRLIIEWDDGMQWRDFSASLKRNGRASAYWSKTSFLLASTREGGSAHHFLTSQFFEPFLLKTIFAFANLSSKSLAGDEFPLLSIMKLPF